MHVVLLVAGTFAASLVEMVEALTIVLAVGVTRSWRPAALGTSAAVAALAALTVLLGPAVTRLPLSALRLVIGGLLLLFGLQWLRKAVLRAGGLKALHDEEAIYRDEMQRLAAAGGGQGRVDWYGVTVAFKGVFLEGLEVVFIVLTFGAAQGHLVAAALAALAAVVLVSAAGLVVHRPLSRVPENALKFAVGTMLTSFGIFWSAEGAGAHWPGDELFILALIAVTAAVSGATVVALRGAAPAPVGRVA